MSLIIGVFLNCVSLGYRQVNLGQQIPPILNSFIIENLVAISNRTTAMIDFCVEKNNLESAEEYKLALQYFESLAKAQNISKK